MDDVSKAGARRMEFTFLSLYPIDKSKLAARTIRVLGLSMVALLLNDSNWKLSE